MKKENGNWGLLYSFAAITGALIAAIAWLYLKVCDLGITLIWDKLPTYLDVPYYTIIICVCGGLVVGIFHQHYGPYPETMVDSVKRVKETGSYPYRTIHITIIAAFLSLFFGGSVGPEAGLVCLLLGLVFWAMDQFGMARLRMAHTLSVDPMTPKGQLFGDMMKGLTYRPSQLEYDKTLVAWTKKQKVGLGLAAGLVGLAVYLLMNTFLGSVLTIPHLEAGEMYVKDRVIIVLLIVVGIGVGYVYLFFHKITHWFFSKLRGFGLHIINAILGGFVLGLIGTAMPMTMFSGGNDIQMMQYAYLQYTPYLLILIGLVKLFLTNVCIESGWRGGHFFPIIFSGLSIGYGFSLVLDTNQVVSVVVVTAALLGTILQQPIGAFALALIFFPIEHAGWMLAASAIGGCVPVPVALRQDPMKRGFLYSITHRKKKEKTLSAPKTRAFRKPVAPVEDAEFVQEDFSAQEAWDGYAAEAERASGEKPLGAHAAKTEGASAEEPWNGYAAAERKSTMEKARDSGDLTRRKSSGEEPGDGFAAKAERTSAEKIWDDYASEQSHASALEDWDDYASETSSASALEDWDSYASEEIRASAEKAWEDSAAEEDEDSAFKEWNSYDFTP